MINAYVARLTMLDENGDIVKEFAEAERYAKSIPDVIDFIDGEIRKAIAGGHYSTEIELKDPTRSLNAGYIATYLNILGYEIIFRNDTKDNYHHFEIDWLTKVLEIIKYINPKTGETGSAIQMFEEEKNSIQEVCTLLECFKKNISDGRDLYEFDFCQKFLKSLTTLSDLSEISGKIDELVFESIPDMVSFYGNAPARPKVEDKEITERLNELKNIIDMFNGLNQKPKKLRKKKKTDDELYEQLRMDLENQKREEE